MRRSRPTSRLRVEHLEERVVLNAPTPFPGAPLTLPNVGTWVNTPFVGSPIFSDLDDNGRDELITPADGGQLIAFEVDDSGAIQEFQRYQAPPGTQASFKSTPIVVECGDGLKMIVAGLGRDESVENGVGGIEDGRVVAFDAITGTILPGWPASTGLNTNQQSGVVGPITSGDLTGDGIPEIVVTSFSHLVTAFRLDGSVLWQYNADDTVQSGAVIGDLDRDGSPEVVFGSDTSDSPFFTAGGFVNILNRNGAAKYRVAVGEVIWSSPALADLNGDGNLEIAVGTGLNFAITTPSDAVRAAGNQIVAVDFKGDILPGWPYRTTVNNAFDQQVYASPAVGDLNNDGTLEVVATDREGFLHVVQFDGTPLPGFEGGLRLGPPAPNNGIDDSFSSPIIVDVDGDGALDVVASFRNDLVAISAQAEEIWRIQSPDFDLIFNAAAVGQFDGVGGLELASATTLADLNGAPNRPNDVGVYQLPESSIEPSWPLHRRADSGMAVLRNASFVERYITATFNALIERDPSESDITFFTDAILSNELSLEQLADNVALTPESRAVVLRRIYQRYLDRLPTDQELAEGTARLDPAVDNGEESQLRLITRELLISDEFVAATDGTTAGILNRMWEKVLRRPLNGPETDAFIPLVADGFASTLQVADLLLRSEEFIFLDVIVPTVLAYRDVFPDTPFDDAAVGLVLLNVQANLSELRIRSGIVASGGNYGQTSTINAFIRSAYGDVLQRDATQVEVGIWIRRFTTGEQNPIDLIETLFNSAEGRELYIREQAREFLGIDPDQALINSLIDYQRREEVTIALVESDAYFQANGGTVESYVRAVFRDVGGVDPLPQDALNSWVQLINTGTPRSELPRQLLETELGLNVLIVKELFRYLPDESKGVLRTANDGPATGPAVNQDPALIESLINMRLAGSTDLDVLVFKLTSPMYLDKVAYNRGLYQSTGIRV